MAAKLISLIAALAVSYVAVTALAFVFQRKLIYFPSPQRPALSAAAAEYYSEVTLTTADGLDLLAWYAPPGHDQAAVLVYFHGNAELIGDRAGKLVPYLEAGHGALLVEYRGYGGNPGRPSEAGLYADGHAALDWLAGHGVAAARVVVYGSSLGSGVAVELAASRKLAALVLEAPFTSLVAVGKRAYPWLPVRLLTHDRFDSLAKMPRLEAPIFIVHGEDDSIVPAAMGRAILAAAPPASQGLFVAGLGHNELLAIGAPDEVMAWLASLGLGR